MAETKQAPRCDDCNQPITEGWHIIGTDVDYCPKCSDKYELSDVISIGRTATVLKEGHVEEVEEGEFAHDVYKFWDPYVDNQRYLIDYLRQGDEKNLGASHDNLFPTRGFDPNHVRINTSHLGNGGMCKCSGHRYDMTFTTDTNTFKLILSTYYIPSTKVVPAYLEMGQGTHSSHHYVCRMIEPMLMEIMSIRSPIFKMRIKRVPIKIEKRKTTTDKNPSVEKKGRALA